MWDSGVSCGRVGVRCGMRDGVRLVERLSVQLGKGRVRCPLGWGGIVEVRVNRWFCGRVRGMMRGVAVREMEDSQGSRSSC